MRKDIRKNREIHNKIAHDYEEIHGEIFNPIEQKRTEVAVQETVSLVKKDQPKVLDIGCGSGNLTKYFLKAGSEVTASDISPGFLDLVQSKYASPNLHTKILNGKDLSEFHSDSYDIVCMYSVLHHIPDYIKIIEESLRVLKTGGILMIDHEHNEEYWEQYNDKESLYKAFIKHKEYQTTFVLLKKLLNPRVVTQYIYKKIRLFIDPRYQSEGDIHVFLDDHIQWKFLITNCEKSGGKVIKNHDYLVYKRGYNILLYETLKDKISDMKLLLVQKN